MKRNAPLLAMAPLHGGMATAPCSHFRSAAAAEAIGSSIALTVSHWILLLNQDREISAGGDDEGMMYFGCADDGFRDRGVHPPAP
ncbi:MAG: hypothetical protein KDL87_11700 [Verrucomicrobiae bacterium]|nr:hypothetical protein [Verrucomicrobiae bacterium]